MSGNTGNSIARLRAVALVAVLTATACTPINRFHGYTPSDDEVATVQVGQSTREGVIERFGPPTSEGALTNDAVYYVSSQFRHFGAFAPEEVDRQILAINFTPDGVVSNISRYTLADGRVVVLDRRVTEDGINDVTFLGQLLGSFGQFNAATLLGEEPQSDP